MLRRIFSIVLVVSLLLFSSLLVAQAKVLELTATVTLTPLANADFVGTPISGAAPLTVQFTDISNIPVTSCTWNYGDGVGLTVDPIGTPFPSCPSLIPHTYTSAGSFTVTMRLFKTTGDSVTVTKTNYIQVTGGPTVTPTPSPTVAGQPDLLYPASPSWIWDPNAYNSANGCYNYTPVLVWNVQVKNAGSADAGSFVVNQNYDRQKTVSGLPAGQTTTLYFPFPGGPVATAMPGQPTLSASYSNFLADYNNQVSESNETNNTTRSAIPTFTATPSSGATRVFCKTPTPGTPVVTFTPTRTNTPGITNTPTRTPTLGITNTPTRTPTVTGVCSPVTSTITAPFAFDGAGTFCWQSSNLGAFINSWNTTSVTINGVNITNVYVPASSYPAKIGGFWYVGYSSSVAWGHFEAK